MKREELNQNFLSISILAGIITIICVKWLDIPIAQWVNNTCIHHQIGLTQIHIPDLLLPISVLVTIIAWSFYGISFIEKRLLPIASLSRSVGIIMPIGYFVKECAQYIFGRINARVCIPSPGLPQFCFFHQDLLRGCFPSGHMMVATVLLLIFIRYYPSLQSLWFGLWLMLGILLVITGYHFLGDVVAGAYLGFAVERMLYWKQNVSLSNDSLQFDNIRKSMVTISGANVGKSNEA